MTPATVRTHRDVLEALGLLAVDEAADAHQYRLRLPFREERRADDAPRPRYVPGPSQPFDILDANPSDARYRRSYLRPDVSEATRCLRPPAAVFDYLTGIDIAIDWEYAGLWERLVNGDLWLQDVIPAEHRVPVAVLRQLIGAPDTVAFRLPGPLARRTELGQRPPATQLSLATAGSVTAD